MAINNIDYIIKNIKFNNRFYLEDLNTVNYNGKKYKLSKKRN